MKKEIKTHIPTQWVGPLTFKHFNGRTFQASDQSLEVPLATYETTLFPSVGRGAKVSREIGGLTATLISDGMTRSLLIETTSVTESLAVAEYATSHIEAFQKKYVTPHSKHTVLKRIDPTYVGHLMYLRFFFETGLAAGHNMTTFAVDHIAGALLEAFPNIQYVSLSGNYCTDKKVSAVNRILGRGKHVIVEATIPRNVVETTLKTTPEKIVALHQKKNLIGSLVAGSLMSANAHYANMLLGFYLATGQDAANIVEGSQGITHAEVNDDGLYFSVNIPNIIMGTVGHGKGPFKDRFDAMGLSGDHAAEKLALIAGGVVFAGELSLLAALTNQHELVRSHTIYERN